MPQKGKRKHCASLFCAYLPVFYIKSV